MSPGLGDPPQGDWLGTPYLRFERRGSVAWCTVDRPDRRNAMTPAMYFGVRRAVDVVTNDEELAALVLTGAGDVFIPGGDFGGASAGDSWGDLPGMLFMDIVPFDALRHARKPVVSAVNGLCQGGGLLIAMLSDVAVVSDRATFRSPELFRGIADMGYARYLTAQIGPARARDMLLSGRELTAAEAVEWGLVARMVPHDEVESAAAEVARRLCWAGPEARLAVKRGINDVYGMWDRMTMEASLGSDECAEGWAAFAERRPPSWIPDDLAPDGRL